VADQWCTDDDRLFAELRDALRAAQEVPAAVVDAAKAAYAWRTIDAELAALTYDSTADLSAVGDGTRAEPASLRALTFQRDDMTIEVELTATALFGQLVPAGSGRRVVARTRTGDVASAQVDEVGYFTIAPVPAEPFRLLIDTAGAPVLTGWVSP